MNIQEYVARRVGELCGRFGISMYRLSQMTGIRQSTIKHILDKSCIPTLPTIEKICNAFGISIRQFFTGDDIYPDLTEDQKMILEIWGRLDSQNREIVKSLMLNLNNKNDQ